MEYLTKLYPAMDERRPIPGFYVETIYFLYATTFLIPWKSARVFFTFPLLLFLAVARPAFTAGSIGEDYNGGIPVFLLTAAYIDFIVLSPLEDEHVRFMGPRLPEEYKRDRFNEDSSTTLWQKVKWTLRLTTTTRGIGWTWQVKNVPSHLDSGLSRFDFVRKYLLRSGLSWIYKMLWLYLIGFCREAQADSDDALLSLVFDVATGWCGACWAYNGINAIYRFAAAVSVAIGLCEQWEWPPMFDKLSDGWSVRQMWSTVYHQILRRTVQKPAVRLARLLGLKKGALASKYLQLFAAFAMSMLVHEWNIFLAVRHDMGEFRFFMSQPLAISLEDFVQWWWQKRVRSGRYDNLDRAARLVGYTWTIGWFSYSLPPFVNGLLSAGDIIGGDYGGPWIMTLGKTHASKYS